MLIPPPPLQAQDAGTLLREQEKQEEFRLPTPPPEPLAPTAPPEPAPEAGPTILVRELRFAGKVALLPAWARDRLVVAAAGRRLGFAGLQALADAATLALQREGRLLARGLLPPQDVTEGVVTIEIVEGRLEAIDFEAAPDLRIRQDLLRGRATRFLASDSPGKAELESALLRLNDLPGVTARGRLVPGQAPGSSRLIVRVEQAPIFSSRLASDNFGSANTGRQQATSEVTFTDVTGLGDETVMSPVLARGQQGLSLRSGLPLGAGGLKVLGSYTYLTYDKIDDLGEILELEGFAHQLEFGLEHDLVRQRTWNLQLAAGLSWKALVDDSLFGRLQDKRATTADLTFSGDFHDRFFDPALTYWSLGWTFGTVDLSKVPEAEAFDDAGLKTQGLFHRLNADLIRFQPLPGNFSLYARGAGQWASKNLDSSEDFSLGGPFGVRAWPVGEGAGDLGLLGTLELRRDLQLPASWGWLRPAAFVDAGRVWVNRDNRGIASDNACACNSYGLAGAGLGLRWSAQGFSLSASYARGLGGNPGRGALDGSNEDGETDNQQFWIRASMRF